MAAPTRWGFMGCGITGNDFAAAMQLLPKLEHKIVAITDKDFEKAKEFATKYHAKVFEQCEDVANCPDIDIVYANVNSLSHYYCAKLALNAGKSVLCETPMGMNARQAREMIQLARQKNVFLMEAFWSRCFPVYEEIRRALKDGRIGEPKFFQGNIGYETYETLTTTPWYPDHRFKKELGNSCMLNFGCYFIMLTTMLFDGQRPVEIQATGKLDSEGVDVMSCVTMKYKNDAVVQLMMSTEVITNERAILFGTKGSLELPESFYCPSKVIVNSKLIEHPLPDTNGIEFIYPNYEGQAYEIQHVRECLLKGLKKSPLMPLEHSDIIISVVDEIRRQVGCIYPDAL